MKNKKILIISGDASGDVYGAELIKVLKEKEKNIEIAALGGENIKKTQVKFLYNLVKEFSVMGFFPVILGFTKVMRFLDIIVDYLDKEKPDLVVLIDYPGFNLYLATYTKKRNIPTVYYVTPQIWAWAPWRIKKIKRLIRKMLVIFPFEVEFYKKEGIDVEYVGHPLLEKIDKFKPDEKFLDNFNIKNKEEILGILPGSRKVEIKNNLPVMLWIVSELKKECEISNIFIALSSIKYLSLIKEIYYKNKNKLNLPKITIVLKKTYDIIYYSKLVLVTSGTATLETAILKTPMVIFYKVPKLHEWIVKNTSFLKCKYISLPNIISDKEIVPEFVFSNNRPSNILKEVKDFWKNKEKREKCIENLEKLYNKMEKGASHKTAEAIIKLLKN